MNDNLVIVENRNEALINGFPHPGGHVALTIGQGNSFQGVVISDSHNNVGRKVLILALANSSILGKNCRPVRSSMSLILATLFSRKSLWVCIMYECYFKCFNKVLILLKTHTHTHTPVGNQKKKSKCSKEVTIFINIMHHFSVIYR